VFSSIIAKELEHQQLQVEPKMLHVPLGGDLRILTTLQTQWAATLVIKLFKNDYTPVDGSSVGNFVEADFDGYASQGIAAWGAPIAVGPRGQIQSASNTFTKAAGVVPNDIYGYYVLDGGGSLLWAERDPAAPIPIHNAGDKYIITPTFTLKSEF
jgi:hypothetical protein